MESGRVAAFIHQQQGSLSTRFTSLEASFAGVTYSPHDCHSGVRRADFAIALYPGHLWVHEDDDHATRDQTDLHLRPDIRVSADTPPTFLLMAEDDHVDGVEQALPYYVALQKAGVRTEMHLYAQGGHGFGLRQSKLPIAQWPRLVETWLHTLGVISRFEGRLLLIGSERDVPNTMWR